MDRSEYTANVMMEPSGKVVPSWQKPSTAKRTIFVKPTLWQRIVQFFTR